MGGVTTGVHCISYHGRYVAKKSVHPFPIMMDDKLTGASPCSTALALLSYSSEANIGTQRP